MNVFYQGCSLKADVLQPRFQPSAGCQIYEKAAEVRQKHEAEVAAVEKAKVRRDVCRLPRLRYASLRPGC